MENNQRGFAVLLTILIIAAAALAGAGVWVYQTQIVAPKTVPVISREVQNPAAKGEISQTGENVGNVAENQQTQGVAQKEIKNVSNDAESGKCSVFSSKPDGQFDKIDLPADCGLNIGKGFENWKFSAAANQKSNSQFKFEVLDGNGVLVQDIPVGGIDYSPNVTDIGGVSGDDINFADDINFDGYKDLRVLKLLAASNIVYDYWIFYPVAKTFKRDPVLVDIQNAYFNPDKKTIGGYSASGPDPANWTSVTYSFVNGKYKKSGEILTGASVPFRPAATTGFAKSNDFMEFFSDFQIMVAGEQKQKIAGLINYPIAGAADKSTFIKNYDQIFSQKVVKAVKDQDAKQIKENSQGAMIGSGEIWFRETSSKEYKITAINN